MDIDNLIGIGIVSLATWLSPMPIHSQGLLVRYGNQSLVEANATYHEVDLSPYWNRCGLSAISPSDMFKVVWVRNPTTGEWLGPCVFIDAANRKHFETIVYTNHEVAEIPFWLADILGAEFGQWGEVSVSLCPPTDDSIAVRYSPQLRRDSGGSLGWRYWPKQELPVACDGWDSYEVFEGAQ